MAPLCLESSPRRSAIISALLCAFCLSPLLGVHAAETIVNNRTSFRLRSSVTMLHELESDIEVFQQATFFGGHSDAAKRLAKIKGSMARTFQALPKNKGGRLAPRAVRYLVHNYFAKQNGWLIKGLGPHGMQANVTEVHDVSILQEQAPALVEAMLEAKETNRGLSLQDVAIIAASLERLIIDDEAVLLAAAYALNGLSPDEYVDELSLHKILRSYLLIYEHGPKVNLSDVDGHQTSIGILANPRSDAHATWLAVVEYEQDAVMNFVFARKPTLNPFELPRYSFQAATGIVEMLVEDYGNWQNPECRQMTEALMSLNRDGSGRVPLKTFYSSPEGGDFVFSESPGYLREIGALDESAPGNPKVIIVNYVTGPSNCVASSAYYSVCCLNECENLMNELEGAIQGPAAEPRRLLDLVGNLSTPFVNSPMHLPQDLVNRLLSIAQQQGGTVPLHGRLFAQWLHYAFPYDCPYPKLVKSASVLTVSHWLDNNETFLSKELRENHTDSVNVNETKLESSLEGKWSDEEVLPLSEPTHIAGDFRSTFINSKLFVIMLVLSFGVYRVGLKNWHVVRHLISSGHKSKSLPLHARGTWV